MTIKVGVVGIGVVGEATRYGMEKLGHQVSVHDLILDTTIRDVLDTDICFVCVPTPTINEFECDVSIVGEVLQGLHEIEYDGIIAIKSTIPPMTTVGFQKKHNNDKICFIPEFLRERCAIADFTQNHDLCVIGSESKEICEFIKRIHGKYPDNFAFLTPTEAEFVKYFNNIYNGILLIFIIWLRHVLFLERLCNENFRVCFF